MQINIRKKYNVNVIAVKHGNDITMPTPDYVVKNDEHLLVLGKESDVAKITK